MAAGKEQKTEEQRRAKDVARADTNQLNLFVSISDFKVRSLSSHQLGTYDGSSHFYAESTFASSG